MTILGTEHIALAYGTTEILRDVTFSINEGDRLGIVGVNGAGKTTLLRLITGEQEPSGGRVFISKGTRVSLLKQDVDPKSMATLYEEILGAREDLLALERLIAELTERVAVGDIAASDKLREASERFSSEGGASFRARAKQILIGIGFDAARHSDPVSALSGGERTRLSLAKILYSEPDILILDEPTNHLDTGTLGWLENYLVGYKKTVITVSHDRYFLDKVTTKTLDIEYGVGKLYNGGYSVFSAAKAKDKEINDRHLAAQQREIAHIERVIQTQLHFGQERNFVTIRSWQKKLDKVESNLLEHSREAPRAAKMAFTPAIESGGDVLSIRGLCKAYGEKRLFDQFNLDIKKGDRVVIIGPNGCGKSTLLKIIAGFAPSDGGALYFGHNVVFGYYDQSVSTLSPENNVLDELWSVDDDLPQVRIRTLLGQFRFSGEDVLKKIPSLSGGERARLTLAKLMLKASNTLLLDEPTNHLDIATLDALEAALSEYGGTIIAVSHDRYFTRKLATKIVDFSRMSEVGSPYVFEGSFAEYEAHLAERSRITTVGDVSLPKFSAAGTAALSDNKKRYEDAKRQASEARRYQTRLIKLTEECAWLEKELAELAQSERENESDHVALAEIYQKRDKLETRLLEVYEELGEIEQQ